MTGVYAFFWEGAIPFLPRQGEGDRSAFAYWWGGRSAARTIVNVPPSSPSVSFAATSPWRGRTCWGQPLAADVRMLPLMPLGKKPPAVTAALLRKTMLSTWPVERL